MVCKVELIPISEGNRIIIKENEKVIVGRGSSLGCDDKKISRQHAELLLKKDETLWIKPTHTNPVFYRPLNCKTIQLTKDIEQQLKDGDQIGLLPTTFFFRISFSTDINNHKDDVPSESVKNHTDDTSSSTSIKDQNESISTDSNKNPRKLPTWMSTSSKTSSTDRPSVKRQLSPEPNNTNNTNKSSDVSSSTVSNKTSVAKSFDSDSLDSFDTVSPKRVKTSDKRRPVCSYGATCYRKNPAHRNEESHPGDSDYEDEKQTKDDKKKDDNDDDKPQCPYGKTCYRKNPEHKRDYKH